MTAALSTSSPVAVRVTRYQCPPCGRTHSSKRRAVEHMGRCWQNPAARGCKTCKNFEPGHDACGCESGCNWGGNPVTESCAAGVSLAGRPACGLCNGVGETFDRGTLGVSECAECGGDGAEIKPGPVVGCDQWEAAEAIEGVTA